MSMVDRLPSLASLPRKDLFTIFLSFLIIYVFSRIVLNIQIAFFGPLRKFPGPASRALTIWPWAQTTWKGDDNTDLPALHHQYGNVVRIAPNQLSFVGDGQIWKDVYGFRKAAQPEALMDPLFYTQNINRAPGLVGADYHTHSRQRKIVSHAFSDKALKEQEPILKQWAKKFKTKLEERAERGEETDMLKMLNCT